MIEVQSFFDKNTSTLSYIVFDEQTRDAVIIDPVMDFNIESHQFSETSLQKMVNFCKQGSLLPHFVLETHVHADHVSSAQWFKKKYPQVQIAIGKEIVEVQKHFRDEFQLGDDFPVDGSQFDFLFHEGQTLKAGSLPIQTWHTPGHTPACYTLQIGNHIFVGDTLFSSDCGTGRCDFPGGSAQQLYKSITQRIFGFPEETVICLGHDYPKDREVCVKTTVGEEKKNNIRLNATTSEEEFVKKRIARDAELSPPRLLKPSLLVNMSLSTRYL